jgi:predicted ArsR family transcriptional regulator
MRNNIIEVIQSLVFYLRIDNYRKTDDKPTIKKDSKTLILEYLLKHKECALSELSEMLGLKATQTKFYLHDLVESGKIIAKGANRNRTYILNKPE